MSANYQLFNLKAAPPTWRSLEAEFNSTRKNSSNHGVWAPPNTRTQSAQTADPKFVAVIIPYRNRSAHLRTLLPHLHRRLRRQRIAHSIFVIEQLPGSQFNRGALFNIGYLEAAARSPHYSCFILHDVDLLPLDAALRYDCAHVEAAGHPQHMSVFIDKYRFRLYFEVYGGVLAITRDQFRQCNGFSNLFFGWGGEDDDFVNRMRYFGRTTPTHCPAAHAYYQMIKHGSEPGNSPNPLRHRLISEGRYYWASDGVNSARYRRVGNVSVSQSAVNWIRVSIDERAAHQIWANSALRPINAAASASVAASSHSLFPFPLFSSGSSSTSSHSISTIIISLIFCCVLAVFFVFCLFFIKKQFV